MKNTFIAIKLVGRIWSGMASTTLYPLKSSGIMGKGVTLSKEEIESLKSLISPIISQGIHEAIIEKEIFDKVQEMIADNPRHHLKQFNGNHLLSGLLRCPDCGYGMSMQIVKTRGKVYEYYTCNQYQTYKRCKSNSIKKYDIEEEFLTIFESAINKPEILKTMLGTLNNKGQQTKETELNVKRKENELRILKSKESKLTDELIEGNDNYKATIRRKIQEVSDEIVVLENDILKMQTSLLKSNASKININEISEFFNKVGKIIPVLNKPAQQSLIRKVITSIKVEKKRIIEIHFSFHEGLKVDYSGDSEESPTNKNSFRVQSDTVNRIISK